MDVLLGVWQHESYINVTFAQCRVSNDLYVYTNSGILYFSIILLDNLANFFIKLLVFLLNCFLLPCITRIAVTGLYLSLHSCDLRSERELLTIRYLDTSVVS